ncbi:MULTISPECIES: sugar transferase [Thalassobacter]|jgi:lipopolysaccharide/colanic/teichoic acid biosynthesis glycosyltransferase|uniref:sugar transferase n=1 Tax=Thalassobacter TaxID=266808 RepID=UPI00051D65F9|nr:MULTISPECIES: sugar transferase [Thalassobacter]KGL01607.1 glycosyl transferase [Thalassobacter sp. 16PALIMAR09]PVZ49922.1 sugar transferase [Thalassobacter stenotrophicus]
MRQYLDIEHYREFRVGSPVLSLESYTIHELIKKNEPEISSKFRTFKVILDYTCALIALPTIAFIAIILLILNPFFNRGPLFFRQSRVGQFGRTFRMWKFRTMLPAKDEVRAPNAAVEENRITPLGRFLRKTRIDEIPNLLNVLTGEMSVIGPRPDAASHVEYYAPRVHGYADRHRVKPGITGLAQVEQGYVESEDATAIKTMYDNLYVERMCGRLDIYIMLRTFRVMRTGFGAK